MYGTIDRAGNLEIKLNIQRELLPAPPENGEDRKWLPCEDCGILLSVPVNIISIICMDCATVE